MGRKFGEHIDIPGLRAADAAGCGDRELVLRAVSRERGDQDAKWGKQSHPDGTGGKYAQEGAETAKAVTDRAAKDGTLTWNHILTEEVLEALAETDPVKLRKELIQVAAVAVAWVEDIDSRGEIGD